MRLKLKILLTERWHGVSASKTLLHTVHREEVGVAKLLSR